MNFEFLKKLDLEKMPVEGRAALYIVVLITLFLVMCIIATINLIIKFIEVI